MKRQLLALAARCWQLLGRCSIVSPNVLPFRGWVILSGGGLPRAFHPGSPASAGVAVAGVDERGIGGVPNDALFVVGVQRPESKDLVFFQVLRRFLLNSVSRQ